MPLGLLSRVRSVRTTPRLACPRELWEKMTENERTGRAKLTWRRMMWAAAVAAADSLARRITSATMASRVVVERLLLLLRYPAAEERFGVKEKDRMGTCTLVLNRSVVAR